jgi:hypothetical protein
MAIPDFVDELARYLPAIYEQHNDPLAIFFFSKDGEDLYNEDRGEIIVKTSDIKDNGKVDVILKRYHYVYNPHASGYNREYNLTPQVYIWAYCLGEGWPRGVSEKQGMSLLEAKQLRKDYCQYLQPFFHETQRTLNQRVAEGKDLTYRIRLPEEKRDHLYLLKKIGNEGDQGIEIYIQKQVSEKGEDLQRWRIVKKIPSALYKNLYEREALLRMTELINSFPAGPAKSLLIKLIDDPNGQQALIEQGKQLADMRDKAPQLMVGQSLWEKMNAFLGDEKQLVIPDVDLGLPGKAPGGV